MGREELKISFRTILITFVFTVQFNNENLPTSPCVKNGSSITMAAAIKIDSYLSAQRRRASLVDNVRTSRIQGTRQEMEFVPTAQITNRDTPIQDSQ